MLTTTNKNKMVSYFGVDFFDKIQYSLSYYAKLWELFGFEHIDYYSVNCLFTCRSSEHGACVLKISNDAKSVENEFHILKEYRDTRFCKVYEVDLSNGVLLLEHINPGMQLRAEPNLDKRLDLFCEVFNGLHLTPADKMIYPTYMGWVSRISEYMRRCKNEVLAHKMIRAEQICHILCEKYSGELLLHGDLHHDNILLGKDNCYRIIDPKGVVGDRVFDIPRFILNEFDDVLSYDFDGKFRHIIHTFSEKLCISEKDICHLVYVEMCMAQCWHVEDGQDPDINKILFVEKMLND